MNKLIGQGASLLLQIIFVVAAVLVFAWFDPFDLLAPVKLKLKDTPIQVQSIRKIGQLITAEYYGEVISSSLEVKAQRQITGVEEVVKNVDDLHENFKLAIEELSEEQLKDKGKETIYAKFVKDNPNIVLNEFYDRYLYFINEKLRNSKYKEKELTKVLDISEKEKLIRRLYLNKKDWRNKLMEIKTDKFKQLTEKKVKKELKKDFRRSRLVLIGRGWVKAGFDFQNFSNRNFKYDKTFKTIHFIGLKPEIISATINPWFIPEEGVEGFEFLIAERHAKLNPKYASEVKRLCLEKLQRQALEKQILFKAQENAQIRLKDFFSILLDQEVKGVYFHSNYLDYTLDVVLSDSTINNDEVYTIDSSLVFFINNYFRDDKFDKINEFLKKVENAKHKFYGIDYKLNPFSSNLFNIIQDRIIDSVEAAQLADGIAVSSADTLWYLSDYLIETQNKQLNKDSLINIKIKNDITTFCNDFISFINNLPLGISPSVLKDSTITVKIGADSCKINLKQQ
jgi:hypothetical protein